jgi:hypothetical protein
VEPARDVAKELILMGIWVEGNGGSQGLKPTG